MTLEPSQKRNTDSEIFQYHTHWIGPNIGAAVFAAGVIIGFQCIQTYLVDSYTRFAASAIAAATVLRSLAGFGFPLFAPYMYNALGYNWGNSLLGFIAIGLGIPAPFLLWCVHFGACPPCLVLRGSCKHVLGARGGSLHLPSLSGNSVSSLNKHC